MKLDEMGRLIVTASSKKADLFKKGRDLATKAAALKEQLKEVNEELTSINAELMEGATKFRGERQLFSMIYKNGGDPVVVNFKWANSYVVSLEKAHELKGVISNELWEGLFSEKTTINRTRQWDKNLARLEGEVKAKIEKTVTITEAEKPSVDWELS